MPPEYDLGNLPKISETEVGDDLQGNIDTIGLMKEEARKSAGLPIVRELALNIVRGIPANDCVQECLAIGDYVKNKVRYVKDPNNIEYLQEPAKMIRNIQAGRAQGDCDDMALLAATLVLAIGHDPFFRAVRYDSRFGHYNHIYVVVYENDYGHKKERVVLDCILKEPIGTEVKHISGEEYPV